MAKTVLDLMEYVNDALAQAAYVSSDDTEAIEANFETGGDAVGSIGDEAGSDWWGAWRFTISEDIICSSASIYIEGKVGSPTGDMTFRIETNHASNYPSGTLAHVDAAGTIANGDITTSAWNVCSFTPFVLPAGTYWLVIYIPDQETGVQWQWTRDADGVGYSSYDTDHGASWSTNTNSHMPYCRIYSIHLQCFSEDTIKQEGSYSLKGMAAKVDDYTSDLLTGGTPSADSEYPGGGYEANLAVDNNDATRWASESTVYPHWWKYDLGEGNAKIIRKLRLYPYYDIHSAIKDFVLTGSNNDSDWDTIYTGQHAHTDAWEEYTFSNSTAYRYYKIEATSSWRFEDAMTIWEMEMMEEAGGSLNDTLTKSGLSIDLSDLSRLKFYIRASRTGSNIKVDLHNAEVLQENFESGGDADIPLGNQNNEEWRDAQSFQLDADQVQVKKVSLYLKCAPTYPTDDVTVRIETSVSNLPSGILVHPNATGTITAFTEESYAWRDCVFTNPFNLDASTTYWIVASVPDQITNNKKYLWLRDTEGGYADGQWAYSKDGAAWNGSAADVYFRIYGETIIETTPNVTLAGAWQIAVVDLSGVANADKDAIKNIIITIVNADADNEFYIDNMFAHLWTRNTSVVT